MDVSKLNDEKLTDKALDHIIQAGKMLALVRARRAFDCSEFASGIETLISELENSEDFLIDLRRGMQWVCQ